jgi:hypothetical protein
MADWRCPQTGAIAHVNAEAVVGLLASTGGRITHAGDSSLHPWPKERFGTEAWLLGPDDNRLLLLVLP